MNDAPFVSFIAIKLEFGGLGPKRALFFPVLPPSEKSSHFKKLNKLMRLIQLAKIYYIECLSSPTVHFSELFINFLTKQVYNLPCS